MVLLVVDTQKAIVNSKLYNYDLWVSNVKEMIAAARGNNIEVIFVRNYDGPGCELTKGNDGFEIYDGFKPADNEAVFDKCVNSAFRNTGLLEYLKQKNEDAIVIVGLQTEYCIDATIKAGFEHGFKMIVPEKPTAHLTTDLCQQKQLINITTNLYGIKDMQSAFRLIKRSDQCLILKYLINDDH